MKEINTIYKSIIALMLLMSITLLGNAQENTDEFLKQIEHKYKNLGDFHKQVVYSMYYENSDEASERYTGYILKKEDVSYVQLLGDEVVQFPEVHILVDNENKTLICSKATNGNEQYEPIEFSKLLKLYTVVSKKSMKNTVVLNMNLNKAAIHIPYKKISLFINKDTFQIEKQILYFSGEYTSNKVEQASEKARRLEVIFKNLAIETPPKLERYVTITPDKKIVPSAKFAGYKVIDQTQL